jgi:hypothetical protein
MSLERIPRPPDALSPAAKALILRLHAEAERAADELLAIQRERQRRRLTQSSSFTDLNQRNDDAMQRYDTARFALNVSLRRQPPNEAAEGTLSAFIAKLHEEQRASGHFLPANSTSNEQGAQVIPFPNRSAARKSWEPTSEQQERGYLTPDDLVKALGVSRATVDKNLRAYAEEIGAHKTSAGQMAHWRIPLDAPPTLKKKLVRKGD